MRESLGSLPFSSPYALGAWWLFEEEGGGEAVGGGSRASMGVNKRLLYNCSDVSVLYV